MLKHFAFLAPIGAVLFLALASLTPYHTLSEIGALMTPNYVVDLPDYHLLGAAGLIVFGIGFVCAMFAFDSSNRSQKKMIVGAAIAFALAAIAGGYGTWLLNSAFINLATAASIDSEMFLKRVEPAKYPLLAGWFLVVVGATLLWLASCKSSQEPNRQASHNLIFACFCGFVLLAAAIWSMRSFESVRFVLQDPQIEPARIAAGVMGLIRSNYLSLAGIAGCVFACLLTLGGSDTRRPSS